MPQPASGGLSNAQAAITSVTAIAVATLLTVVLPVVLPMQRAGAVALAVSVFPAVWLALLWVQLGLSSARRVWLLQALLCGAAVLGAGIFAISG